MAKLISVRQIPGINRRDEADMREFLRNKKEAERKAHISRVDAKNKASKCCEALQNVGSTFEEGVHKARLVLFIWREELPCQNPNYNRVLEGDLSLGKTIPSIKAFLTQWENLDAVKFWRSGLNCSVLHLVSPLAETAGKLHKEAKDTFEILIQALTPLNIARVEMKEIFEEELKYAKVHQALASKVTNSSGPEKPITKPPVHLEQEREKKTQQKMLTRLRKYASSRWRLNSKKSYDMSCADVEIPQRLEKLVILDSIRSEPEAKPITSDDMYTAMKDYLRDLDLRFKEVKLLLEKLDINYWPVVANLRAKTTIGDALVLARQVSIVYKDVEIMSQLKETEKTFFKSCFLQALKITRECTEVIEDIIEELEIGKKLLQGVLWHYSDLRNAPPGCLRMTVAKMREMGIARREEFKRATDEQIESVQAKIAEVCARVFQEDYFKSEKSIHYV